MTLLVLVDTANLLAELAAPSFREGRIATSEFAAQLERYATRQLNARIFGVEKTRPDHRIYITDTRGRVVFDTSHEALGQDY